MVWALATTAHAAGAMMSLRLGDSAALPCQPPTAAATPCRCTAAAPWLAQLQRQLEEASPDAEVGVAPSSSPPGTEDGCRAVRVAVAFNAPRASSYSGARFAVDLDLVCAARPAEASTASSTTTAGQHARRGCPAQAAVARVVWQSDVYHPYLRKGHAVCGCMLQRGPGTERGAVCVLAGLERLLSKPHLWVAGCERCVVHEQALAELRSDVAFFSRKARACTPYTHPPPDDELRAGPLGAAAPSQASWASLLTTGTFSDIKLLVGRSSFRCHRTILAAASPVFRDQFAHHADGGVLRLPGRHAPASCARFLQHIYTGRCYARDEISAQGHLEVALLAHRFKVASLERYCTSVLASLLHEDTACDMLLLCVESQHPLTPTVLAFLKRHERACRASAGWTRLSNCPAALARVEETPARGQGPERVRLGLPKAHRIKRPY